MNIIAYDPGSYFTVGFQNALIEHKHRFVEVNDKKELVELFIKNSNTDVIVLFLSEKESFTVRRIINSVRVVNSVIPVIAVFTNKGDYLLAKNTLPSDLVTCLHEDGGAALIEKLMMVEKSHGKKRGEHRLDCKLHASVYEHDEFDIKDNDTVVFVGLVSLSANGAYIQANRNLPAEGETRIFQMSLPDYEFIVKGKIVWVNSDDANTGKPPGYALVFTEMAKAPQQLLKSLVEEELIDSILQRKGAI